MIRQRYLTNTYLDLPVKHSSHAHEAEVSLIGFASVGILVGPRNHVEHHHRRFGRGCVCLDDEDDAGRFKLLVNLGALYFAATPSIDTTVTLIIAKGHKARTNFGEVLDLLLGGKADDHVLAGSIVRGGAYKVNF